jgi:hypothetical protein
VAAAKGVEDREHGGHHPLRQAKVMPMRADTSDEILQETEMNP